MGSEMCIRDSVTIDPRPVRPVNHCFTTCTGRTSRTSRVKPFTGRIRSTVLDKDAPSAQKKMNEKFPELQVSWKEIYSLPFIVTVETKIR